jgi:gliding motility-associated-like protein
VEEEFSVIEIYNLITPNGDGVNDVLDMSLLKYKIDVKFQIFDRLSKNFLKEIQIIIISGMGN